MAFADTLPGGLDNAQPLDCAWEFCMIPGKGEAPYPIYVAFGDTLYCQEGSLPPGTSPDDESNFLGIKYKENFYAALSYRHTENISHSWSVTICTLDGKACKLDVKCIYGALGEYCTLKLFQGDGETLVADLSAAASTTAETVSIDVAPGKYLVRYAPPTVYAINQEISLKTGWNLIALPFSKLTSAKLDEEDISEAQVYLAQEGTCAIAELKELVQGKAGWLYSEGDAVLKLQGECETGSESAFPEYTSGRWNFLGVVGKCDAQGQLIGPGESSLPDGAMRWDETKKTFGNASGTPAWCMGYLVK